MRSRNFSIRWSVLVQLTLVTLFCEAQARAQITLLQHAGKDAGTTTSSSLAFPAGNTAGNWLAVVVRAGLTGQEFTVTDTRGNTYRQVVQLNEMLDAVTLGLYYAENIAGGPNTVTVSDTLTGGTLRFAILEYAGVAASGSLDGTPAVAEETSASLASAPTTTTANGDLILGVLSTSGAATFTAGAGFTLEEQVPVAPNAELAVEDQKQTAAGPIAATATLGSGQAWAAAVAAFRAAAAGPPPPADLTLTKTHTGSFTQGQSGAVYTLTVSNSGASSTVGTVTVTDTLPAGLTATALSGTGWACTLATLSCNRSDVLAAASYPAITLTVDVSAAAPASVTNVATVSGGSEIDTANNTASDPTSITPVADLSLTKTHTGSFTQGQTGATYILTVSNTGTGPSSGTVTMTDTLPGDLTATALGGTGWNCILATVSCTRSDALPAGMSYPAITLTVSVASTAPASLTNAASVFGGGETNTANNTASDDTLIGNATVDTQSPTPPGSLSATAISGSQINVTWAASTDNTSVTAYRLERCAGVGCSAYT